MLSWVLIFAAIVFVGFLIYDPFDIFSSPDESEIKCYECKYCQFKTEKGILLDCYIYCNKHDCMCKDTDSCEEAERL